MKRDLPYSFDDYNKLTEAGFLHERRKRGGAGHGKKLGVVDPGVISHFAFSGWLIITSSVRGDIRILWR